MIGPPTGPEEAGASDPAGRVLDIRSDFHRSLDRIDDLFTRTALTLAEAMPSLHRRYRDGDASCAEAARTIADVTVDRVRDVEDAGLRLLAREAPVGRDLRRLVAIQRVVRDVSRCATLLDHVCATVADVAPGRLPAPLRGTLDELARHAAGVYAAGVGAWRRRDALACTEVQASDEAVDRLQVQLHRRLRDHDGEGTDPLTLGLIGRYYERIADHGVAIARDTAFVVTGERVATRR